MATPSASNSFKEAELKLLQKGLSIHTGAVQGFTPEDRDALEQLISVVLRGGDIRGLLRNTRLTNALRKIPTLPVCDPVDPVILGDVEAKLSKMLARVQTMAESGLVPRRRKLFSELEPEPELEPDEELEDSAADAAAE